MKEQKLFKAVSFIDEELISEAADYMPPKNINKESGGEAVYATVVRVKGARRQMWKYPVTAAALLAVAGGAMFIADYKDEIAGEIKDDLTLTANDSEAQSEDNFVSSNESEMPSEESSVSITEVTDVEEKPVRVTPIKTVPIYFQFWENSDGEIEKRFNWCDVACTDSFPTVPTCSLGKECFEEMNTEELFKYYGLEFMLPSLSRYDGELIDENSPHGIYTSPDGIVYDINTFVFSKKNEPHKGSIRNLGTITITAGKNVQFGQEYDSGHHSINDQYIFWYDESSDTFFAVYNNINGDCSIMISAKADDLYLEREGWGYKEVYGEVNGGISPAVESFFYIVLESSYIDEYIDDEIYKQIDYFANEFRYYSTPDVIYPLEN